MKDVRLAGSRAEGGAHQLSDWDLSVETADFERVAADLPGLVEPLRPLAQQWDPYSSIGCYMLMFPGPVKVDLLFPDEPRDWSDAWVPGRDTLEAIDRHFWDWILWLEQKRRGGRAEAFRKGLADMHERMLRPMGAEDPPGSIREALAAYLGARDRLEHELGITLPRALEREVRPVIESC